MGSSCRLGGQNGALGPGVGAARAYQTHSAGRQKPHRGTLGYSIAMGFCAQLVTRRVSASESG